MNFYNRLAACNRNGLSQKDAIQLLLWSFSSLSVLPPELRNEMLGRQELTGIFSRLAQAGIVKQVEGEINMSSPGYWDALIDRFMTGSLNLDQDFPAKIPLLFCETSKSGSQEKGQAVV
jgi:hypothetical protein